MSAVLLDKTRKICHNVRVEGGTMAIDYHFTVYGDDYELGIFTNDEAAMEAFKRDHPDWIAVPTEFYLPPRPPVVHYAMSRMRPRGDPRNRPPRYDRPPPDYEQATTPPVARDDFSAMPPVAEVLAARRAELEARAKSTTQPTTF
jgi:hypothetical protein